MILCSAGLQTGDGRHPCRPAEKFLASRRARATAAHGSTQPHALPAHSLTRPLAPSPSASAPAPQCKYGIHRAPPTQSSARLQPRPSPPSHPSSPRVSAAAAPRLASTPARRTRTGFELPQAPLADAALTKLEVRALAKAAGYPVWDRPAAPCLSSRVEYGRTVTREVLEQVERGEESLRQLGFRELRVRHHGELARVEIAREELPRALTMEMMDAITAALKQAGFKYVTLDCAGFRSGSMNAVLPVEVLARKGA